ncbi:MAG: hypothetical protein ACJ71N_04865 [Terriglobales bacterium]|jgi:hypothetical protein
MRKLCWVVTMCAISLLASAQEDGILYKATLIQAAPGKLLELIDLEKKIATESQKSAEDPAPVWMRHSQGDRWDLLIISPVGTYADYYRPERAAKREKLHQEFRQALQQDIAWQEDVFVHGPPLEALHKSCDGAGLFHVEMFQALPGKHEELFQQRVMENRFSHVMKLPENVVFVRDQGAAWDVFTVGCYRNLKHYAEGSDLPPADAQAAAKAAGFESNAQIGPYLRTLISLHRDTLAVAIK